MKTKSFTELKKFLGKGGSSDATELMNTPVDEVSQNKNDKKLEDLMKNKPSEAEVEQAIAKNAKSLPKTPHIDELAAQRAQNKFNEMMKNQNLSNVGLDEAGAANPKALAGAVVPGALGMLAAHLIGKTPDLQLDLKDAGAGSDVVPKDAGHFNEDPKFKKLKDILENR
jgi:hypothetical protein